jgi:hypothetical protein
MIARSLASHPARLTPINPGSTPGLGSIRRSDIRRWIYIRASALFLPSIIVIFGLDSMFDSISHPAHSHVCHEDHPLLLVRRQCPIKWLPCVGELLEAGSALAQCLGSAFHAFYRIAITNGFDWAIVSKIGQSF